MKARVLFGVGGFLFVLLALYVLPPVVLAVALTTFYVLPPVVLAVALTTLGAVAAYELTVPTGLVKNKQVRSTCTTAALIIGAMVAIEGAIFPQADAKNSMLFLAALVLLYFFGFFALLLRNHDTVTFPEIVTAMFGGIVLPLLLLSLWRIFAMDGGEFLVLLPLVAAWGSDTCALFAGMAFGKHKLAPVISPKKTVEGAAGGVLGATVLMLLVVYLFNTHAGLDIHYGAAALMTVLMLLVVYLFNTHAGLDIHYGAAALMGAVGAVIGQVGDLSFSIIKRQTGIKDYGHIFPGHGGVLDRFDSVIFVAPVAELILRTFGA